MLRTRLSMGTLVLLISVAFGLSACATSGGYAPDDYGYADVYPDGWLGGWGYWGHGWGHWEHAWDHNHHAWDHEHHGAWARGFPAGHPSFTGHGGFGEHGSFAGHAGGGFGGHGGGGGGEGHGR